MIASIWKYCKNWRFKLVFLLGLTVLDACLAAVSISMVMPITSALLNNSDTQSLFFLKYIENYISFNPTNLFVILGCILLVKFITSFLRSILSINYTENMRQQWQQQINQKYMGLPYKYFAQDRQGEIIDTLVNQANIASNFIYSIIIYISNVIIVIAVVTLLFLVNWKWILSILVFGCVAWFVLVKTYFRFAKKLGKKSVELSQNLNMVFVETLQNIKDIKISNTKDFYVEKTSSLIDENTNNRKKIKIFHALPALSKDFIFAAIVFGLILVLPDDISEIENALPQISVFIIAFSQLLTKLSLISSLRFKVTSKFQSFVHTMTVIHEFKAPAENLTAGMHADKIGDYIRFEDVNFSYDDKTPILRNINLQINKGDMIAIYGPSGSGKTTMMDVLMRLYEPSSGKILTEYGNIADFSLQSWRSLIGYVPQDPVIYHGTIRENITLDHLSASDGDIMDACRVAMIDDFINELPDGLDSMLQEGGKNLSGGQKKRLALARVILPKCPLIILDETTNAIEEKAEQDILKNLKAYKDRIILVISHRTTTQNFVDRCFEVKNKTIKEIKIT